MDVHGAPEEPHVKLIQGYAKDGLSKTGHHGVVAAMGVARQELPSWDDIQVITAQLYRVPLLDDEPVATDVVIGPNAQKPLRLDIPLFVSDMSFGALSEPAKIALAMGAELAGTGICSGEGGMLPEEQAANSRYFYELASARFGFSWDKLAQVQAFHFKGGQGAKTGTGGHLPGIKVQGKIAKVRGLKEGEPAVSPARFPEWTEVSQIKEFADEVSSDMSFGALSEPAKIALAMGAELAGTGICSGEGGMLPEEQAANSRYFYELASARFGFSWDKLAQVQAFHFKGGQGAKTGTGGHLPGIKVQGKIAKVRGLKEGEPAVSPARFPEWTEVSQIKEFADEVRDRTGGIPIGYKLSAQHIERDIDAALAVGVDYIILDGRGGGTGAAPIIFRDNISVPRQPIA